MDGRTKTRLNRSRTAALQPREFAPLLWIGALCLVVLWGISTRDRALERELEGAALRHGTGTVTRVTAVTGSKAQDSETRPVLLELDGRPVQLNLADPTWANWLYMGQRVSYTYRVGRSGTWYIEQIAPANALTGL